MPPGATPRLAPLARDGSDVARQIAAVRDRIAAAAGRAGRRPEDIRLVAVSKTFGADAVRAGLAAGQLSFGENKVQEALGKIAEIERDADLRVLKVEWHLIGNLQSNKARKAAAAFSWIESIDRPEILARVDEAARDAGTRPRVLVQVDLAHESTKHGADRTAVADLIRAAIAAPGVELRGLMTVPPFPVAPEDSRPWFRQLRDLRDALVADGLPADRLRDLSMGMSMDFEVAIEEGATMVRVGTAIFGRRVPPPPAP